MRNLCKTKHALTIGVLVLLVWFFWHRSASSTLSELEELKQNKVDPTVDEVKHLGQVRQISIKSCRPDDTFAVHKLFIPTLPDDLLINTYNAWDYISREIGTKHYYEPQLMFLMKVILDVDKSLHLLDIGCNVSPYSLLAMTFARKVVAVDALLPNLQRSLQSVCMNHFAFSQYTAVWNAICRQTGGKLTIVINPTNVGGSGVYTLPTVPAAFNVSSDCITLDDLLPLLTFQRAVMKLDIENGEYEALLGAGKLFSAIDLPIVLMEWSVKSYLPHSMVSELLQFFYQRDYQAFRLTNAHLERLEREQHIQWPQDVIWVKKKYSLMFELERMLRLANVNYKEMV